MTDPNRRVFPSSSNGAPVLSRLPGELARGTLLIVGGWMVHAGWIDSSMLEPFVSIATGVITAVAALAWSLFAQRRD